MPCTLTPLRRRPSAIPLAGILAQLCRRDVYPLSAQRRACIAISCIVVRLKVALQKRTTGSMWTTMFQPWMDDQAVPCSNIIGSEPIPRKEGAGTRCHQLCRVPAGSVAYCAQTEERTASQWVGGFGWELKWGLQEGAHESPFQVWRRGCARPRRAASLRGAFDGFFGLSNAPYLTRPTVHTTHLPRRPHASTCARGPGGPDVFFFASSSFVSLLRCVSRSSLSACERDDRAQTLFCFRKII